ncbi:TadE/TadG family type IV pilus assembly protein [Microbacterium sp.]|uniref:TadE/TadG family type IV pilus assembly protein n=1 Tax=Microbacterium sp. TaxID=51671 RepID=UPI0031FEE1FF|nr:pilus assembly protein [Microbacterium sp.]
MVEFALILPLLALLLVMAIDFGRVFFGWVGVHNAARIAANAAASNPDAWSPPVITSAQNAYRLAVLNDLKALNCERPGGGAWTTANIPDPTFVNKPTGFSLASTYEVGDHAVVSIDCEFKLITPLAGSILGSPISIGARAEFMVRGGLINGIPIGPAPPPAGCVDKVVPNLIGLSVAGARTSWTTAGFTGGFIPATGSDSDIVTGQVTSPPSSPNDCLVETASVTVTHTTPGPCTAPELQVPNLVGLTVAQARSTWTGTGFTGSFSPASGSDTNIVSDQTTVPSATPGDCEDPSTTVSVTHAAPPPPQCTMPQLLGLRVNAGQTAFTTAGFTGAYTVTQPPNGNYLITSQSRVAGQMFDCSAGVTVSGN